MKHILYIAIFALLFCSEKAIAQDATKERSYIHTDKEYYVAGETMWLKYLLLNQNYQPSNFSKTAYVEIADAERPYVQLKLALKDGQWHGKTTLPSNMPSGIYELCGYTRYMRNGGKDIFFKKYISVINPKMQPIASRAKMVAYEKLENNKDSISVISPVKIATNKKVFTNREQVQMTLSGLPDNVIDVVVSVSGCDSLLHASQWDKNALKNEIEKKYPTSTSNEYLPEYEGHIITGKLNKESDGDTKFMPNIAFVGGHIRYINGQEHPQDNTFSFYTNGIYGIQDVVTSITSVDGTPVPYRIDIVAPFAEKNPENLPILEFYPSEKQITDRYVASQIHNIVATDSTGEIDMDYYDFIPTVSYDLDQWKRFNTLNETLKEFVYKVSARKVGNTHRLYVFSESLQGFNKGNTLVLLDGVPIFNHDEILNYNPRNIKILNIYDGHYIFSNEMYDAIVSLVSKTKDLPFFKLNDMYQLFKYDCPYLSSSLNAPDYSTVGAKDSRIPDMRHTLYWNTEVKNMEGENKTLSFYTSDMSGNFVIRVTALTNDGQIMQAQHTISVK